MSGRKIISILDRKELDLPDHLKFGYQTMVEKAAIRERLIAQGMDPESPELRFAVERAWEKDMEAKPTFRERQEHWQFENNCRAFKNRKPPPLTVAELDYLIERLAGINDPEGQRLRAKLEKMR